MMRENGFRIEMIMVWDEGEDFDVYSMYDTDNDGLSFSGKMFLMVKMMKIVLIV